MKKERTTGKKEDEIEWKIEGISKQVNNLDFLLVKF